MYLVYKDTIKIWGRGLASAPVIRFYLPFVLPFIVGLCPSPLGSTSDGTPPACCHCTYPLPSRSSACHSLLLLYPPPCHCCIPPPPRHFHPRHHVTPFFAVVVLPSPSSSCHSPHRGFDALHVLPMGCIHWVWEVGALTGRLENQLWKHEILRFLTWNMTTQLWGIIAEAHDESPVGKPSMTKGFWERHPKQKYGSNSMHDLSHRSHLQAQRHPGVMCLY